MLSSIRKSLIRLLGGYSPEDDAAFMGDAIEQMKECVAEGGELHPKVGAVVVRGGKVIARARRGGPPGEPGEHAEFIALRRLCGTAAAGATLYTTLEPCTVRGPGKMACAEHIVRSGIRRVVIGILDPNPDIQGEGIRVLIQNGIDVHLMMSQLGSTIMEVDARFIEAFGGHAKAARPLTIPATRLISPWCEVSATARAPIADETVYAIVEALAGERRVERASERLEMKTLRLHRLGMRVVETVGDLYMIDDRSWVAMKKASGASVLVRAGLCPVERRPPDLSETLRVVPDLIRESVGSLAAKLGPLEVSSVRVRIDGIPLGVTLEYVETVRRWAIVPDGEEL